jgi:general secretion pathway protein J
MGHNQRAHGFTLVEVLIAMAITAFVSLVAYTSLSAVISGVEGARAQAQRMHELNRAFSVLSRDIRQFTNRPVVNEFGQPSSALEGGVLAQRMLSFTRAGWHNTVAIPRSTLQRVAYVLEDDQLVRLSWPVLDLAGPIEPQRAVLIDRVQRFDVRFLPSTSSLRVNRGVDIDRRLWQESWIADVSQPGTLVDPPVAVEVRVEIEGWGELERLYVLPPL